jgi:hypothetical protein
LLIENYDPRVFDSGVLPHQFEKLDETLRVANANLLFNQLLGQICQHVQYDFEMLLFPQKFEKEWRLILSLLIDFQRFKTEY